MLTAAFYFAGNWLYSYADPRWTSKPGAVVWTYSSFMPHQQGKCCPIGACTITWFDLSFCNIYLRGKKSLWMFDIYAAKRGLGSCRLGNLGSYPIIHSKLTLILLGIYKTRLTALVNHGFPLHACFDPVRSYKTWKWHPKKILAVSQ